LAHQVLARAAASAVAASLVLAGPALASSGGASFSGGGSVKSSKPRGTGTGSAHLGDRVLRQGMRGHDVRVLQGYLTLAGFPTHIDGSFGSTTKRSVIAFQNGQGMNPDGIVTIPVEQALRSTVKSIEADPPSATTRINSDGTATAPAGAPSVVQNVVAAANQIIDKPYKYGGGHGSFTDSGYDCSGSVSFALHGGGLLSSPQDSTGLESYGTSGPGHWITIYANSGHAFMVVAGRAFDTANYSGPNIPSGSGPRWRSDPNADNYGGSWLVRHPTGL
jgi:peptidoglycan hydrolase-like protein with peptidoglycan-binding domain